MPLQKVPKCGDDPEMMVRYLICVFPSIIAFKHPVKICIEKQIFLYRFMQKAEKCEKYRFWLQKVVKS